MSMRKSHAKNHGRRVATGLRALSAGAACLVAASAATAGESRPFFDDNPLPPESHYGGAGTGATGFNSGDWSFPHVDTGFSWEGFSYSNETDTTTPGFGNQFAAVADGGVDGSANYGIATIPLDWQSGTYDPIPQAMTATGSSYNAVFDGLYVTNTTYAYLDMRDGSAFTKKFGGATGDDPDWFKLTIKGIDTQDQYTGTVEFFLADYRFGDNQQDYIVDEWTWVDLSSLGNVAGIEYSLSSSDTGNFGMNTPGYFAIDAVPEPSSLALLVLAGSALVRRRN